VTQTPTVTIVYFLTEYIYIAYVCLPAVNNELNNGHHDVVLPVEEDEKGLDIFYFLFLYATFVGSISSR
jgi:hypothetical protein